MASFVKPEKVSNLRAGLSKWERDELKKERRKQLTKFELHREIISDGLRCPLCFCLPCAIIAFIFLILVGIYIVRPYEVGGNLIKTRCRVNRTEYQPSWKGYCSQRTDEIVPCIKIIVNFNSSKVVNAEAVLMESEQALVQCTKCSFTSGKSDLLGRQSTCFWNTELDGSNCLKDYMRRFAAFNASYSCYYDPENLENVVRALEVSYSEAVLAVFIPLMLLVLWIAAFIVVLYDRYKRRIIDGKILLERYKDDLQNGKIINGGARRNKTRLSSNVDFVDISMTETELPTLTSNPGTPKPTPPRIKKKKKLPCSRSHFQFNYLDEGILLEDKPILPEMYKPLGFNYLTIETSPSCSCCHHNGLLFTSNHYTHFTPTIGDVSATTPRKPGQILRYLPESFV